MDKYSELLSLDHTEIQEYEAKRLEMGEKVAKAQARVKSLDLLDTPPGR